MEFRDAVKHLRSELGLTQVELATGLNINAITVGRWENGKTLPTRSLTAALLAFARSKGASKGCLEILATSITAAAKERMEFSGEGLYAVEHASLRHLIDEASFPIYVCDVETDELLYLNRKASGKVVGGESAIGRKCYECLMSRKTPCESCHKNELSEVGFTNCNANCSLDGTAYQAQGKLIPWNGRRAQVIFLLGQGLPPETMLADAKDAAKAFSSPLGVTSRTPWEMLTSFEKERSAEQLKAIFENINGGVSVVVYDSDGTMQLAYANDRYYTLFGYTQEQFNQELKAPHDTVHPEDWDSAAAAIGQVKKTKQAATFRYRIIKRDGSIAHLRCNSSVAAMEGVSGFVLISILTDITESVKTEQQAIVSGQRLDAIMQNMNSAVTAAIIKDDGSIEFLFTNDLYFEMFGYTKEQFFAEVSDPFKLAHPEDEAAVRSTVFSLHSVGDAKELLYRGVTRNGSIKWFRARISMMTFPDAEGPVQLAVYSDVTNIVQAREKLAAQNNQIMSLLNDTPSGIAIIEVNPKDIVGTIHTVYYNDRFFEFSGYDRDEYDALLKENEMAFVFEEDLPILAGDTAKLCAGEIGVSVDTAVRCHTKDGGFRWLLLTAQLTERREDICVINIAMIDITDRQEAVDRQRISDEMLRIAAETDQRAMIIYDVKNNSCRVESRQLYSAEYGKIFRNIPQSLIEPGIVAPDSEKELRSLFSRIRNGEHHFRLSLQMLTGPEQYEWFECNATTVFDAAGLPDHAVLVFHNITEQRVKEAVFKKWQQSIDARPDESYTLFRCNLSRDASLDEQDGSLLKISFSSNCMSFNDRTKLYAKEYVHPDDREEYVKLLDSDLLLAMFYRGEHFASLDYREMAENKEAVWRRLTIETVEYRDSTDVQAFLMYEDIDAEKKIEFAAREQAENDQLTGVLNRSTFVEKVEKAINENPSSNCALIILDMDGFKLLNDTFGHAAGDQALRGVAAVLRSYAREGDLVCRLGGDEFLVWLRDIPYDAVIGKTAQQMCEHIRKAYSQQVLLSASAGIAVYPRDGHSYDELYPKADKALYRVKESGKGSYAFFSAIGEEQTEEVAQALSAVRLAPQSPSGVKRRMLIVDDVEATGTMLADIFKDEYLIETAKSSSEAMIRLRHFGASIAVVLLDLLMPKVDGFAVLQRMQMDDALRIIPTVIVTGDEEHETLLKAFELGAAEYVTKPVDEDIIRMRVQAVISKAESDRLRAQNSYLMLQRNEEVKYRTVLQSTGTVVVEYDWRNHVFIYDNEISKHIAGNFDHRGLWQVLLSDMVADSADVKLLQDTLIGLASSREQSQASKLIKLNTPEGIRHWFRFSIYKSVNDFGLTEKLIITFNDVHEEVLANDRLLFQATRDELTGLYNRTAFLEKAAELIAAKERGYYVMACIDIEKFQVINDRYGTERGDEVLKHIAASVCSFVERNNGISCRYTADRFAVLYPAELLGTTELAENHRLSSSPKCIPRPLRLRIGRCMVNDTSLPVSAIFDRAAMAEALAKGRYDTYIVDYDESMRDSILREQQIVGDMVDALNNGEFEPWFQPQYNHSTGALVGAEALVRWRRDDEIIPPNDFVPVFEKNGFIYELDQYVWRQVCALLRRWLDEGKNPPPVSVNISRYDMLQENFINVLTGLIEEYRLPVELLRLEVTESAFSADTDTITVIAGKLIDTGFTVEIDDFGSGYSSLNTLKDVPASILKLDMRFFEKGGDAKRGGNIVESIVRMAKWLGMAVIAEGVEDMAQADYLKSIGCVYIQGFLYAKPMPMETYEKQLETDAKESKLTYLQTLQNLDNNGFWDSRSMDTLIFNSYVGAACIIELNNDKVETLRATDHYIRMLGGNALDINDVLDIDWTAHMDERNIRIFHSAVAKSIETRESVTDEFEFHGLPKCPETVILRISLRVIATAGERSMLYCLIDNMTAQRMAERDALNASERINAVMDHSRYGISAAVAREDGSVELVFVNNRFFEILGYTQEQYAAEVKSPYDRIYPEDRDKVINTITKLKEVGSSTSMEVRQMRRDGSIVWLRCDATIVKFANIPEPVQIGSYLDITEQKETELKQLDSARRLEAIMENLNSGVSASIFHDETNIEIVFANDGFYKLFGYTKEQFEAEVPRAIDPILPEDRHRITATVADIVHRRGSETYEYRCYKRDGSVVWIQTTNTAISLAGVGDTVLLAVTTDITKLRRAEEQRQETSDRLSAVMNAITNGVTAVTVQEKIRFLFANDRYYQLHGIEHESGTQGALGNVFSMLHTDDRERVRNTVLSMNSVGQSAELEYRVNLPGGALRYVKVEITVTTLVGIDAPVQVAIYTDITEEKKSGEQLRFLNESASQILAQADSEMAIRDTLGKLLAYFAGERSYIFELNDATQTSNNTYEVCAPGVTPESVWLKSVPYDTQQYWFDAFRKTGFVAISDVTAIEDSEKAMRKILLVQNIHSIIVAPLWRDGRLIGYMGVDNPTVAVDQVSQLIALSDYIAVLLTRRDLVKAVERERQTVQQLMDDTPGGFVCMELFEDRNPVIITVNDGLCKMLGMTKDEAMQAYGNNAYACLAEGDAAKAPVEMKRAYAADKQYTSTCQLRKKDGGLLWVMLFGRFVKGDAGRVFLNAYFTDITEQRSMEQLQVDLLDNLPFGAAMFEYDGNSLTALHINKQYILLVNQEVSYSLDNFDPGEAIHPDDRKRVFHEIGAAIREGRSGACDIRLLYGKDEYRFFHLDASIVPHGDGKYVLYVAYAPITDKEQELKITTARLKLLSDSIPGGIATFRCMPGSIESIYYNDGICALTGYSREEFDNSSISVLDLIFNEDMPVIQKQLELVMGGETALDYSVRIHTKGGDYKWVECMASVTERESETVFLVSAVLTDVTGQQEERERLRVSEELNRLAIDQSGNIITRYDVAKKTLTLPYSLPDIFDLPRVLENMPDEQISLGRISPDTADAYSSVFLRIHSGEASGEAVYQQNSTLGWRWLKSQFTTVFANDGAPVSAVITFEDITEQRDKEAIYTRWQNAMAERDEASYTLVRCNLNKPNVTDSWDGSLLRVHFTDSTQSFNSRTTEYAEHFIYADDKAAFCTFLNSNTMLAEYHRGHRSDSIDYREQTQDGGVRWLRLTVDLVEYPDSTDVEAYLLFENIDEQKHAELSTIRRAETDPLTGLLNRATFIERVNTAIDRFGPQACHALLMLDIDNFKQINDVFGHGAGDQALVDIANTITRFCRKDDLVGRLGGDEFVVFLPNIGSAEMAAKKARELCSMARKPLSADAHVSISIGIALHPQNGDGFETLYKVADEALYRTKNAGKDGYSFITGDPVRRQGNE